MKNIALASLAALTLTACTTPSVEAQSQPRASDAMQAFPEATADQKRHVIQVPQVQNEDEYKVELIVGQTKTIDCNNHTLGGQIEERTAQGWGYNYYVVPRITAGAATLMGCPNNSTRESFVTLVDRPLVRYNSRLPIVVYTPKDTEVRYRVWRAGEVLELN